MILGGGGFKSAVFRDEIPQGQSSSFSIHGERRRPGRPLEPSQPPDGGRRGGRRAGTTELTHRGRGCQRRAGPGGRHRRRPPHHPAAVGARAPLLLPLLPRRHVREDAEHGVADLVRLQRDRRAYLV